MPLVLGALLLSVRGRTMSGVSVLGLAAGAKLWPILLAPLLLRPLWSSKNPAWKLIVAATILGLMMTAWVLPPYLGGIDETSGFVAFANYWQTNSAFFPVLAEVVATLLQVVDLPNENAGLIARATLGVIVAGTGVAIAVRPWLDAAGLLGKVLVFTTVLFLLSPAQFPWYAAWMMPFLSFRPSLPLLGLTALLPIYYASFHFLAREQYDVYRYGLVWLIWLPVWMGLGLQIWRRRSITANGSSNA